MGIYRPFLPIADCPNCGKQPEYKFSLFKGPQMRCRCGVSGPFIALSEWPEHEARNAWSKVAGEPKMLRPPPPPKM